MFRNLTPSWRPRLESLEDRSCPSCTVAVTGSKLTVNGDANDNSIEVIFWAPGDIAVSCDGTQVQISAPIDEVIIRSGAGNDTVLAGSLDFAAEGFPSTWRLDLGNGDDVGIAYIFGFFDIPVNLCVLGGNGADVLVPQFVGYVGASYDQLVDGGNGNDSITNWYSGYVDGDVSARAYAGNGDDEVFEIFSLKMLTGSFDGQVDAGNGSDAVTAWLGSYVDWGPDLPLIVDGLDVDATAQVKYSATGGNGHDALSISYLGRIDGQLDISADGGNDYDQVYANIDVNVASSGRLNASFRGGHGDDQLDVRVRFYKTVLIELPEFPGAFLEGFDGYSDTPAPLSHRSITADGGNGFDSCLHSPLVNVLHVEDDDLV